MSRAFSEARPSRPRSALVALTLLLLCLGTPVLGQGQTDADKRIEELEKQLEQIKADLSAGEDVTARVEALEEALEEIKTELAGAEAQRGGGGRNAGGHDRGRVIRGAEQEGACGERDASSWECKERRTPCRTTGSS